MLTVRLKEINWDQEAPHMYEADKEDEYLLKELKKAIRQDVKASRVKEENVDEPDFLAPDFEKTVTQEYQQVMIINDMGFGKTMFCKYLFQSQFDERLKAKSEKTRVYINLKDMMHKEHSVEELIDMIAGYLAQNYELSSLDETEDDSHKEDVPKCIRSQLDKLHFLFDGLDECAEEDQYRFVNALAKYKMHISFILTSRDIPIIKRIRSLDKIPYETHLAETPSKKIDELLQSFVKTRSSKGKMKEKFKALLATPLFYKEFETLGADKFKGSADSFVLKPSLADFYLILLRASLNAKKTFFKTPKEFVDKLFDTARDSNEHINNIRAAAEYCYQDMCSKSRASVIASNKGYTKALIGIGWCHESEDQVEWKHLSYKEFLAALHIAKIMQNKANLTSSLFAGELKHDWKIYEFTIGILVSHAMEHPESNFIKTDLAAQLNYLLAECDDDEIKKVKIILEDLAEDDALTEDKQAVYKQMMESLYFDVPSVKPLRKILTPFYLNNLALLIDLMVNPDPKRNEELTNKKIGTLLGKGGENEPELTKWIKDIWSLDEIKEKFDLKIEKSVAGSGRIDLYLSPKADSGIDTLILLEFKKGIEDKEIGLLLNKAINQALVGRNSAEGIAQTMETSADPSIVFEEVYLGNPAYQSGYINAIKIESHVKNIIVVGGVYIVTPKKGKVAVGGAPKQEVTDVRFKVFERIISVDDLKISREVFKNLFNKMLLFKREIFNHAVSGFATGNHVQIATSMLDHLLGEIKRYKEKLATASLEDVAQAPAAKRPRVELASADDDNIAMLSTEADDRTREIPIASDIVIPAHKFLDAALDLESSEINSRKHTESPDIIKINFNGTDYDINCSYEYEDHDITAILDARISEYNGKFKDFAIYFMAAVDTVNADQLKERLSADKKEHDGKRIILIPCNISNYHWVGLLFEFDESNNCIRAEFINSTDSSVPLTLERQLQMVYAGMEFTKRFDLIKQDDGTSCGACTIENLVLSMTEMPKSAEVNMASIRARHLDYLNHHKDAPEISERERDSRQRFFESFNERQRLNQLTFDSTKLSSFKDSANKSESEVLAIAVIGSLILDINADIRDEIIGALGLSSEHKAVLDELRDVLWKNMDDAKVQELSMRLFGLKKDSDIDTKKKYREKSSLLFEYEYLQDIYKLTALGHEEIELMRKKVAETHSKANAKLNASGHDLALSGLTVLSDGRLASSSRDKTIRLWNVETGVCEAILQGHKDRVNAVIELSEGKLASGGWDGLRVWNVEDVKSIGMKMVDRDQVPSLVALSDDRLASCSLDQTIRIWDVASGECERRLEGHKKAVTALIKLSDGRLASGSLDRTIRIWNVESGECESILENPYMSKVTVFTELTDGRLVAGSSSICIWDVKTKECVTIFLYDHIVLSLVALPDGRLASGFLDKTIRIWNVDKDVYGMNCDSTLTGHKKAVIALTMLPDGRLASASEDKMIRLWNVEKGACELVMPKDAPKKAELVAKTLSASPGAVAVPTVKEGKKKICAKLNAFGHDNKVTALTVLSDGRLASGSGDKTIRLWNVETGVCAAVLHGHKSAVTSITALPDGKLASSAWYKQILIWDVAHAKCTGTLDGHTDDVTSVITLRDGRLASGSSFGQDYTIRIWNVHTMKCELTLVGHGCSVEALAELSDGRLASSSNDKTIRIWNVATGECESTLEFDKHPARSLAVLPDGRLVSGSHEIRIWNVQTKKYVTLYRGDYYVLSFAVLPDGRLAEGSWDKKIYIWNVHTMTCELTLEGHKKAVTALTMLPDGRLASASEDKTIRLWNVETGECELVMPKDAPKKAELVAKTLSASPGAVAIPVIEEGEKKTQSHSDSAKEATVFAGHKRSRSEMSNSISRATSLLGEATQPASQT